MSFILKKRIHKRATVKLAVVSTV